MMNAFQKDFCRKLLRKLENKPTATYYKEVDKTKIDHRGDKDKERAADIATIRAQLDGNEYASMKDFGEDVLSMLNTVRPKRNSEAYTCMAEDLRIWFNKKWVNYPRTPEEQWFCKIAELRTKVDKVFDAKAIPIKEELLLQNEENEDKET